VLWPPRVTLSPARGTPDGDQLLDLLQFPLLGAEVLPDPFQIFDAIELIPQK
jgi:hypothetical protein